MRQDKMAALLYVSFWGAAIVVTVLTRNTLPVPDEMADLLFWSSFLIGMAAFVWALAYLRGEFLGLVEPQSDQLVKSGPYRWVRHPVYLSTLIVTLGFAVGFKSLWGLVGTFLLVVPATVFRARLEEQALEQKFGQEWQDYASRTSFMLPMVW